MTDLQKNNPLHGLKLDVLLTVLVEHYGWEILAETLKLNCFKNKPTMVASLKFLRKTTWAREKVEAFYLYRYCNLPRPDDKQYALPPRDRTIPLEQKPREPVKIDISAEPQPQLASKTKNRPKINLNRSSTPKKPSPVDPWAKVKIL